MLGSGIGSVDMASIRRAKKSSLTRTDRLRHYKITNRLYHYVIFLLICPEKEKASQWFDKKFGSVSERPATIGSTFLITEQRSHAIWFPTLRPQPSVIGHEAFHSVWHVLRHCSMGSICEENEDAYAYLLQWTIDEITSRLFSR